MARNVHLGVDFCFYAVVVTHWTFLTNHALVLMCIAQDPEMRLSEIADHVGITERATQRIVADLADSGYIERIRTGRRNRYNLHRDLPMRHPLSAHQQIGDLLVVLSKARPSRPKKSPPSA